MKYRVFDKKNIEIRGTAVYATNLDEFYEDNKDLINDIISMPLAGESKMEETKTTVVHCMRDKYDIYIGRPGKWGNPFSHQDGTQASMKVASRDEAVDRYKEYILNSPLMNDIHELKGKVLGCWCKPKHRCHGDVLVELVEATDGNQDVHKTE